MEKVLDYRTALSGLMAAKELAAIDTRIEGYHLDDFSTGSIDAGVKPEHLAQLQFANAAHGPQVPLGATIYTMSVDRPELPALLPFFAQFLVPLWHADKIDTVAPVVDRLSMLSGGKPVVLCLYAYDFGNMKLIPKELMQRHLDTAEELLLASRISGVLLCGTCMMDIDWESNKCFYEWLEKRGQTPFQGDCPQKSSRGLQPAFS